MIEEPRLLDQLRDRIRLKHYSIRTEKAYLDWNRRFILFHNKKHPSDMGIKEVERFLTYLAVNGRVASSTQNQALSAILFMYKEVLKIDLPWLNDVTRAKRSEKVPLVFTKNEIQKVLANLDGIYWIMAHLLYGAGLRLMECLRLRVKDIDFGMNQLTVRDGKGKKDRVTMLPEVVKPHLKPHLQKVKIIHKQDLSEGYGEVYLPYALERKYPRANKEWGWQYVFPSRKRSLDPRSNKIRRNHVGEQSLQRIVKKAIRTTKLVKPGSCHTLRHHADSRIMPTKRIESGALLTPLQFKSA